MFSSHLDKNKNKNNETLRSILYLRFGTITGNDQHCCEVCYVNTEKDG